MARSKEINYFDVLITACSYSHQTSVKLNELMHDFTDIPRKASAIHDLEHKGDEEVHRMYDALHFAFITPIDREDLFGLIKSIDDITDHVEDVANRFDMFAIKEVRPDALTMGAKIEQATTLLMELVTEFKTHKRSRRINSLVRDVNTVEEEGDRLYRESVKRLFTTDVAEMDVIKWKDIYDDMENVLDACEDVANIIEGVIVKNS
jgi:predicted phosphate transport protein (TIGR00153 family)